MAHAPTWPNGWRFLALPLLMWQRLDASIIMVEWRDGDVSIDSFDAAVDRVRSGELLNVREGEKSVQQCADGALLRGRHNRHRRYTPDDVHVCFILPRQLGEGGVGEPGMGEGEPLPSHRQQ